MNNLVVIPIVLPVLSGIFLIFFKDKIVLQRIFSFIAILMGTFVAFLLLQQVNEHGIQTLQLGGWIAPYGIILVADMFSVLLLLTANVAGLACLWYSFKTIGIEREKHFYYPLFLFLMAGVSGSFLTGDIFNLFVFFEVMLISSYALLSLGGTRQQLKGTVKYLLINIVSSTLFVTAVAYLYGAIGTLNMAHLSERVAATGQSDLLTVISILFLIVFSLKAALFLYFWLPESYTAPPTAIAAIFSALLTKVGIYAIFRMFTLIFYHKPEFTHQLIAWMGFGTILLGIVGVLAYTNIKKILVYNIIITVGFVILGLAFFTPASLQGAVFYLIHDIIAKALLFLIGGAVIYATGTSRLKEMGGLIKTQPVLGWMFFITALALAGIPPLSGFAGKVLIVQGGLETGNNVYLWLALFGVLSSLFVLYSLIRIFLNGFYGTAKEDKVYRINGINVILPIAFLLLVSVALGIGAEVVSDYVEKAAETLADPSIYIQAVLKE